MDTFQLMRLLKLDAFTKNVVISVLPKDELPKRRLTAYPMAFVCNTDDGDEPGEHSVAVYVDADRRVDYFDSYGLPPQHANIRAFLFRNCDSWMYNDKRL